MLRLLTAHPEGDPLDVDHVVRVQRAVLGHRLDVLDHAADLVAAAAAFLDRVDHDHHAVLESGSTAHVSATDALRGGVLRHVLVGLRLRDDRRRHRHLAQQLPRRAGAQPGRAACRRPGTRLLSNMAPTVARHDEGSTLAIGSPGADRITTAIAQVLAGYCPASR